MIQTKYMRDFDLSQKADKRWSNPGIREALILAKRPRRDDLRQDTERLLS